MDRLKALVNVITYRLVWLNLIIIVFLLFLSFRTDVFIPFLFLFISNFYDVIGFYIVLKREWTLPRDIYEVKKEDFYVAGYRIIQNMFDYLLLFVIFKLFGLKFVLSSFVLKLFGVQDVLFYVVLRINFPRYWTWLEWTPLGILKKSRTLKNSDVLLQALCGFILSIIIVFL